MAKTLGFRPIPLSRYRLADQFWLPRIKQLVTVGLPAQFDQIANQTPRLENFRRVARKEQGSFEGRYYDDSDVYKWLQACALALAQVDSESLRDMANDAIQAIVSAQDADGYIGTFFQLDHPHLKFRNLAMMHELYCMGHLIEAAVEWSECLNDDRLLCAADRLVDLLLENFGPKGQIGFCGHQELEIALIRYSACRKKEAARELARRMIEARGARPSSFEVEINDQDAMALSPWAKRLLCSDGNYSGEYLQDHAPIREHRVVVGHAVRAMYFYTASTEFAHDDEDLMNTLESVWKNMVEKRMYVTGGIGSTAANEGFSHDYDLPNFNGYAETCASVGLALWGRAMFSIQGNAAYLDDAERAIFNGALAGISESGDLYFYENPLESRRNHSRVPWFECACCPPNIARMIAGVGQLAVFESVDAIRIGFPIQGEYTHQSGLAFRITSDYPSSGDFSIEILVGCELGISLGVRYPEWCDDLTFEVEGIDVESEFDLGFVSHRRNWKNGDRVRVSWELAPRWIRSHPSIFDNLGKVALARGPVIYCLESTDPSLEARHFAVDSSIEAAETPDGIIVDGYRLDFPALAELYQPDFEIEYRPERAKFVPYYSWANQGPSSMAVWIDEA